MTTPALTSTGLTVPRAADYLDTIHASYETGTGIIPDWERDTVLGQLAAIMADELGTQSELLQAVYDARSRNNATGVQLDDLGTIIGVTRNPATYSVATVLFSGSNGTVIPQGTLVQGGGSDGLAQWATLQDATIAGGLAAAQVRCTVAGAVVAAMATITTIVTPYPGVASVTNAAAVPGNDQETDADFRNRQQASLAVGGSASAEAIRAQLAALDFVEAAVVVENDDAVYRTISGIYMDPCSIEAVIYPSSLTADEQEQIAQLIYDNTPAGTKTLGGVSYIVTKADGLTKIVRWAWATNDGTTVAFTTTPDTGYVLADYQQGLIDAVTAWFQTLNVGQEVTLLDMYTLAGGMIDPNTGKKMIRTVTALLIDGAPNDKLVNAISIATLTLCTVA